MKIDALAGKKLSCIIVAMSLIVSPASAIAEESESVVASSEVSEAASETTDEAVNEANMSEAVGVTDSEIETNDCDYQDNIFVSSSLLSIESASPAITTQSDEDIASGEYYGLTWKITSDGTLVLGDGSEQTYGPIKSTSIITPQPWNSYITSVTSVKVDGIVHATSNSLTGLLANATNLLFVDLDGLDTSSATTTKYMFYNCSKLTSLDISSLDTSSVTDMGYMFANCYVLASLDISGFDTSKVTSMNSMFNSCRALASLDVSKFDTSNVTSMSWMFFDCRTLTSLDISNFVTTKVTNMSYMFGGCKALASLDVSNFVTSSVTNMSTMFSSCGALTTLNVSNFDTSSATNMSYMFSGCSMLASLDVGKFNTAKVTNMSYMFQNCSNLTLLDISDFVTTKVTNMSYMFGDCNALMSLDVSNFDTSNVTNMSCMFSNCSALATISVNNFVTTKVTDMSCMFNGCCSLVSLDVSNFDTSNVTNMRSMFYICSKLAFIDISNFDMRLSSSTYNTSYKSFGILSMLAGCNALSSVKLGENNVLYASGDVNGTEITCSVGLPDVRKNDDYQGKWWIYGGTGYTASDLMSSYDGSTMSGTYEWMPVAYAITYVAPDGLSFENGEQAVTENVMKNDSFEVPTGNYLLEDYAYYVISWNTKADGSGTSYEEGVTYTPTSDVTLYAVTEMGGVATGKTDIHNLDSDGDGYGDNISFSVPTSIYGYVNADGSVFVNDSDFYIENCSSEDIAIKGITSDGWDSRVNVVDDASSSTVENAMSVTMEPVASSNPLSTAIKNGSMAYLYDETSNPNWKVGPGSFASPTKLYIDVEMNVANADDGLFSYEPMKIGSMHWYCQLAKYADIKFK